MESGFSDIHSDVIQAHILPRLDGCTLATVSCVSAKLRSLATSRQLWARMCNDTWPSTNTPRLRHVISSFPNGPQSFFSLAFPLISPNPNLAHQFVAPLPDLIISAVDLFYKGEPVLSKTQDTETVSGWFRSAPFRVDLLDNKEVVPTPIPNPARDDTCHELYDDLELSWIVIDPIQRLAINLSSVKPVSIHRHWLTGEVHARFAIVMDEARSGGEAVVFVVEVTCSTTNEGPLRVREVGFEVEDMEGMRLSGKESLEVIQRGMEWRHSEAARGLRGDKMEAKEARRKYEGFVERRWEKIEKRKQEEEKWDLVYVGVVVTVVVALFVCFW